MDIRILECLEGASRARGLTVIIDVFRAFTVEAFLINNGVSRLYPVGDVSEALAFRERDPNCLLVGERGGRKIEGFDFGNSPSSVETLDFTGKTAVHTTSAGTQGVVAAVGASEILLGSLVTAAATARYIRSRDPEIVSLVCMGLAGKTPTEEDGLCARYIKGLLENEPFDLAPHIERLKHTDGAKFFDKSRSDVFPERDFHLSTRADFFDFALRVEKNAEGKMQTRRVDI